MSIDIEPAVHHLRDRVTRAPTAVVILGSGLADVVDELADPLEIAYADIPSFPRSTVDGHRGALYFGVWSGVEVAMMQGRFHLYEGHAPEIVALPLRVLRSLGADHLVVTNAAGGLRPDLRAGDLMLIVDHINLMFRNPLIGPVPVGEERFPDMSEPYDAAAREAAVATAADLRIPLARGVYAGVLGPTFETPAEVRMLRRLGADAVGMSTVPEVVVARSLGMRVLGVSTIANTLDDRGAEKLTHDEVLAVAAEASGRLAELLRHTLPRFVPPNLPSEAAS